MASKSPIRVGILGLGIGDADLMPGLWAAKAHLPYLLASPHYTVTAVSNSTAKSAQASIDHYNLGPDVKAYGSPSDLAADPNVDLVVVSVRVATHYALAKPALLAGKDVFVEWPLAATLSESEDLTALAKSKGVQTIVGVQARASPLVAKLRQLIVKENALGSILSSTVNATFSALPHDMFPAGAEYYLDMNSGGNAFDIFFGHFFDSFTHVLGSFSEDEGAPLNALLDTKYRKTKIMDFTGGSMKVVSEVERTAPDHIFVQGRLASGALASLAYRTVPTEQVQEPCLVWTITGTEAELVVEAKKGQWQTSGKDEFVVKMRKGSGEVEIVDLGDEKIHAILGSGPKTNSTKNVGLVYEAFVAGDKEKFATFESALESQRLLERIKKAAGK